MTKLAIHWKILIGLVLGVVWAVISSNLGLSQFTVDWIKPWGDIFIKLLKLLAIPLILFSIIKGVSSLSDIGKLGRLGVKTLGIYIVTTMLAVSMGLMLVNVIQPGNRISDEAKALLQANIDNYAEDAGLGDKITYGQENAQKQKESKPLQPILDLVPDNLFSAMSNNLKMLQIIVFAIFFGVALIMVGNKGQPVRDFVDSADLVIIKMIDIIMKGAPFFVFCLLAGQTAQMAGDNPALLLDIFKGMAWFSVTAIIGLLFFILIFYPTIARLAIKHITFGKFYRDVSEAQLVAFSTSSSAATLPVTMEVAERKLGVPSSIVSFVLPIGATVNMDGTSMYQAICAVFLAQFFGIDLTIGQQLAIVGYATLASIGTPAIPSAGLVMLIFILEKVGLNGAWVMLIFPIDRPLDMLRTVCNVTGDATVAMIVAKTETNFDEKIAAQNDQA